MQILLIRCIALHFRCAKLKIHFENLIFYQKAGVNKKKSSSAHSSPTSVAAKMQGDFNQQKMACLDLCSSIIVEIKRDPLRVDTKKVTRNEEFSTKATVRLSYADSVYCWKRFDRDATD